VRVRVEVFPADAMIELDGAPVSDRSIQLPQDDRVHKLVITRARFFPAYVTETRDMSARAGQRDRRGRASTPPDAGAQDPPAGGSRGRWRHL